MNRTYSSPTLKGSKFFGRNSGRDSQQEKYSYGAEDEEFYVIGDRVFVDGFRAASVAYFGEVEFASGDWLGVVLDEPSGHHDGKVLGRHYFQCAPYHGLFVKPNRARRLPDSAIGSSTASSRVPTPNSLCARSCSRSPAFSHADSYYYDDDYRQERKPTVASLERKLRSINNQTHGLVNGALSRQTSDVKVLPVTGILKRDPRSQSTEPAVGGRRAGPEGRRSRAGSPASQSYSKSAVFNFRPKRAQLEEPDYTSSGDAPFLRPSRGTVSIDLSSKPLQLGDRVVVRSETGDLRGVLCYLGETNFATGEWAGIELDEPKGKNDGSILGYRYFHCPKNYGLFVPAARVKKLAHDNETTKSAFGTVRNTITSPPPPVAGAYSSRSSSATPSHERLSSLSTYSTKTTHSPSSSLSSPINSRLATQPKFNALPSDSYNWASSHQDEADNVSLFDDRDIELQLKRSLEKHPITSSKVTSYDFEPARPRSIRYTFSSSKYDGNPIARRTIDYD